MRQAHDIGLFAVVFLAWANWAAAQDPIPVGGEIRVNEDIAGHQKGPRIAMDRAGRFTVVWQDGPDANVNGKIELQRFSADGVPEGPDSPVSTAMGCASRGKPS